MPFIVFVVSVRGWTCPVEFVCIEFLLLRFIGDRLGPERWHVGAKLPIISVSEQRRRVGLREPGP